MLPIGTRSSRLRTENIEKYEACDRQDAEHRDDENEGEKNAD